MLRLVARANARRDKASVLLEYGNNVLMFNNGGDPNPQTSGAIQIGTNVCGSDTVCP